jgi:GPI mannosyltransferase 3
MRAMGDGVALPPERAKVRSVAVLVALVPAVVAVVQLGRLHPDEVFQVLEPANVLAFGYGIVAWEWEVGLRNWAVPGLFAGLLKLGDLLGVRDPLARRIVLAVPLAALHFAMLLAVHRIAVRKLPARSRAWALWAIPLVGLYGPVIHFAARTLSESYSTALVVLALERLESTDERGGLAAALGGALLGLAVVTRYGTAVAVLAALAWLAMNRSRRTLIVSASSGLAVALALGALDWATWGAPFHSFAKYVEFNVTSGQAAAQFGTQPWWFYVPELGALAVCVWPAWAFARAGRFEGSRLFEFSALAYLLAISLTPHKEVRFFYPGLVLLLVAATPHWLALLAKTSRARARWVAVASLLAGPALLLFETPFQPERGAQFRMVVAASRSATGLVLVNEGVWGSPGYFYLGKNIPWFTCDVPEDERFVHAMATPTFNRAVIWDDRALTQLREAGFEVLKTDGRAKLLGR